jgi:hypothetical protein
MTRQGTMDTATAPKRSAFDQDVIESELFASVREMGVTCFLPELDVDEEPDDT